MKRLVSLLLLFTLLVPFSAAYAQDGDVLFEETFENSRTELAIYDDDGIVRPEFQDDDESRFARIEGVLQDVFIEPMNTDPFEDFRLDLRVRMWDGNLFITGRNGDDCAGYTLTYTADSALYYSRSNENCIYTSDFGVYEDDALAPGEWVHLSMEFAGSNLTVEVNGERVFDADDHEYSAGDVRIVFQTQGDRAATLDLASVRA